MSRCNAIRRRIKIRNPFKNCTNLSCNGKTKTNVEKQNIALKNKTRLMCAVVISILLYACETWTLTAELKRRIQALEMKYYHNILYISYTDHVTKEEVRKIICRNIRQLATVRRRKLRWYGHVTRSTGLAKTTLQGTVRGKRKRGRQKKNWNDNIREWTSLNFYKSQMATKDRKRLKQIARLSSEVPQRP